MIYPSVWTGFYQELTAEECILRLKQAGFCHSELCHKHAGQLATQSDPTKRGLQLRSFLEGEGFSIPQGHLHFSPALADPASETLLKKELELFMAAGIHNAVLHFNGARELDPEARQAQRLEQLRKLQAFVSGTGVYLCLENLGSVPETHTVQQLLGIIEATGGTNLGICLDTGHLHLVNGRGEATQTQQEFILTAGRHLRALHITENNGKNDVHQMPYSARFGIDWPQVVAALRQVGYDGIFNMEVLGERNGSEPIREAKLQFLRTLSVLLLEG